MVHFYLTFQYHDEEGKTSEKLGLWHGGVKVAEPVRGGASWKVIRSWGSTLLNGYV
jgi:hypothetical protein